MKKIVFILIFVSLSQALFSQVIQLRRPTAGDSWPAYSQQRIEWNSSNIDNIKIESSLDSGRTWNLVINSYPASASYYEWDIPNYKSDSCFIRISDATDPTKSSSNFPNNPFKIPSPGITIDSLPTIASRGTILPITWNSSGVRKVNIYASYNNKANFVKIADTIIANQFYYNWLIPDTASNQCFIVVQDAANTSLSDTSALPLTIAGLATVNPAKYKGGFYDGFSSSNNQLSSLALLSLINADSLYGSTIQPIHWSFSNLERINILYSPDNGATWQMIAKNIPATAGKYDWKVSNIATSAGRIKIINATDSIPYASSPKAFVIKKQTLKFSHPNATTIAYKNTVLPVEWISGGINYIQLKLLYNNKDSTLKDSLPAVNEVQNWSIHPSTADTIRLVITALEDSTIADTTQLIALQQLIGGNPAKYKGGGYDGHSSKSNTRSRLELISPNGGEILSVVNNVTISWRSNNVERIQLELSVDSGKTWNPIITNLSASAGNYLWKTPNSPSAKCLVRITDAADISIKDVSDSVFLLDPKKLKNTTDSTNWIKGTAKSIEWNPMGVDTIRITYKKGITEPWKILADSVPAKYELLNWILPADLSDSLWIKMEDISDSTVNDSKSYFNKTGSLIQTISSTKFKGGRFDGHAQRSNINKLIINRPLANEILVAGSKYTISWSTINLEDSVWIQYSVDSGATWATVARTVATSGSYEWNVPSVFQGNSSDVVEWGPIRNTAINAAYSSITSNAVINSTKCQIRVLDILSGNVLVGKTTNTFTIVGSPSLAKDSIYFTAPPDMVVGQSPAKLTATSKLSRTVQYFIASGTAKASISGNQVTALAAGKVKIGAYIAPDPAYSLTDTAYQTLCINPLKPSVSYSGKTELCTKDSITISGPAGYGQYVWSNTDTTRSTTIRKAVLLSLKVGEDGCFSTASDTLKFTQTSDSASISIIGATALCPGDTVVLTSNSGSGNQWYKNGLPISGANLVRYTTSEAGTYMLKNTSATGCISESVSAVTVTLKAAPAKPTITQNAGDLISSSASGNQWYYGSILIAGATNSTYRPGLSGYFKTQVRDGGCLSPMSEPYYYLVTGVNNTNNSTDHYQIMPNPVQDRFMIQSGTNNNKISVQLIDSKGGVWMNRTFTKTITIDISAFAPGTYIVLLTDTKTRKQESKQIIKL